ncbi:MAG TPA: TonB-dependent receptor [Steroidobacteraceae bacterium]
MYIAVANVRVVAQMRETPDPAKAVLAAPIGPQALSQALAALARETSLQFVYESRLVAGLHSRGVPAGLSVAEALQQLLRGTDLQFEFLNARTIELVGRATPPARPISPPRARHRPGFQSGPLREVIVTAEKRKEDLSAVPISAAVLSGRTMAKLGVKTMRDIAEITPGITMVSSSQWGPGIVTDVTVRGVTSAVTINNTESSIGSPTTGVYIDDIPITMPQTSFTNPYPVPFDLARVEVLRGPQGTLFGGRAEGGAVRFVTGRPSTDASDGLIGAEVATTATGGPSDQLDAAVGGPLIEGRLGARASVYWRRDGGYVDRVDPLTGATVERGANRSTTRAARLALQIEPNDSLSITPWFMYQSVDEHDSPSFFVGLSDPGSRVFRNGKLLRQPAADAFSLSALKVRQSWDGAELTSITSWFDRTASGTVDTTNAVGALFGGFGSRLGPPYPTSYADAVPTQLGARDGQFTQEVRIASRDGAAPLSWLGGVFYSHVRQNTATVSYTILAPQAPYITYAAQATYAELAGFVNATLRFSSHWRAFAGGRVTRASTEVTARAQGLIYPTPGLALADLAETPLTPRFGLMYEDGSGHIVYASAAKGFRTGGTNQVRPSICDPTSTQSYGGDSLWSYELGTTNRLLGRRLRVRGSLFYVLWKNIQTNAVAACTYPDVVNAGSATSRGFDLTIDFSPAARTDLALAVAFVDARYSSTVRLGTDVIMERGTAVGGVLYSTPPWSATITAEHRVPFGRGLSAYAGIDFTVHSHNPGPFLEDNPASSVYNPALRSNPATQLLGLRIEVVRYELDIRLSVFNALDSTPVLLRNDDRSGSPLYYGETFRPRTVALSVTERF